MGRRAPGAGFIAGHRSEIMALRVRGVLSIFRVRTEPDGWPSLAPVVVRNTGLNSSGRAKEFNQAPIHL